MPLDPTWVPFCRELWSSAEQQQNYLPGIPEGSDLRVASLDPENHYVRIKANISWMPTARWKGTFTISAEGRSDSNVRIIFTRMDDLMAVTLEGQLLNVSPKARLTKVDYGKDPKNYGLLPIKITFSLQIPEYAVRDGNSALLPSGDGHEPSLRSGEELPAHQHRSQE